jgi:tRNA (uracil-5-)-methyltransferase TRM9
MQDYNNYNDRVNPAIIERLLDLNRQFYAERGRDFAATRTRLQPGVLRVLATLGGSETILDLGCGNGALARELSRRGHGGAYWGVDSSPVLLAEARQPDYTMPVRFMEAELVAPATAHPATARPVSSFPFARGQRPLGETELSPETRFQLITSFAVLHHIPGQELRLALLQAVRGLLPTDGTLAHSHWQFSRSGRLRSRIQPWAEVGFDRQDLDDGDYLLDWRRGGRALRYVHEFSSAELAELAARSGFEVVQEFLSDGLDRRSGLYQIWQPTLLSEADA